MYQAKVKIGDYNKNFPENFVLKAQNILYEDFGGGFLYAYPILVQIVVDWLVKYEPTLASALQNSNNQLVISKIENAQEKYVLHVKIILPDGNELVPKNPIILEQNNEELAIAQCYLEVEEKLQTIINDWLSRNESTKYQAMNEGQYAMHAFPPVYNPDRKQYSVKLFFIKQDGTNETSTIELFITGKKRQFDREEIQALDLIRLLDYCNLCLLTSIAPQGLTLQTREHILRMVFHRAIESRLDKRYINPELKEPRGFWGGTWYVVAHPIETVNYPLHQWAKGSCKKMVEAFLKECYEAIQHS
ncbi:MAG: hypothetical protein AB7F64_03395, partial [Gammaproteobacteria bacterium]